MFEILDFDYLDNWRGQSVECFSDFPSDHPRTERKTTVMLSIRKWTWKNTLPSSTEDGKEPDRNVNMHRKAKNTALSSY